MHKGCVCSHVLMTSCISAFVVVMAARLFEAKVLGTSCVRVLRTLHRRIIVPERGPCNTFGCRAGVVNTGPHSVYISGALGLWPTGQPM